MTAHVCTLATCWCPLCGTCMDAEDHDDVCQRAADNAPPLRGLRSVIENP